MIEWGLLPEQVKPMLKQREWDNKQNLRARLTGQRPFPIRVPLKLPTGNQALQNLEHFQKFQLSWQNWPLQDTVQWLEKHYRQLGRQSVPSVLQLDTMQVLISCLGPAAVVRSQKWEEQMRPVLSYDSCLYPVLVRHITTLEAMSSDDCQLLAQVLPQLQVGMGKGNYLRALPLRGVDSKFVENYQALLTDLLDNLHNGDVIQAGGLQAWLDCCETPRGWLLVRPLNPQSRIDLSGLPLLQLSTDLLLTHPLPATKILIVENKQSGYALPELEDTIAVFGGGRNTAWMNALWLRNKRIAYWGDIDSWGLTILSEARARQPGLQALMMDETTVLAHQARMVDERESIQKLPEHLTVAEQQLFERLHDGYYSKSRLEQERLSPDYVLRHLHNWHQKA